MFSLDDRAGNIIKTVALFVVAGTIPLCCARRFLCFAAVSSVCLLARPRGNVGTTAIAAETEEPRQRDCSGIFGWIIVIGSAAYKFGATTLAAQIRNLNAAIPQIRSSRASPVEMATQFWEVLVVRALLSSREYTRSWQEYFSLTANFDTPLTQ
jgi:hypothetical protein